MVDVVVKFVCCCMFKLPYVMFFGVVVVIHKANVCEDNAYFYCKPYECK